MAVCSIGSLFAGIGGLDLGLERTGLGPVLWQVERDPFCRSVLARHWPRADRSVEDVTKANAGNLARVDLVCGGFPCQDVSSAGAGAGLAGARSGLWFEFARIVDELRPRVVVVENVASGKGRWLCPVRYALHAFGYETTAWAISAADCGAPHRRRRIFVVGMADADLDPLRVGTEREPARRARGVRGEGGPLAQHDGGARRVAHPDAGGFEGERSRGELDPRVGAAFGDDAYRCRGEGGRAGDVGPAVESDLGRSPHGIPRQLDPGAPARALRWPARPREPQHAWEPPRAAYPERYTYERLSVLGNAVVPACAEVVGRIVLELLAGLE